MSQILTVIMGTCRRGWPRAGRPGSGAGTGSRTSMIGLIAVTAAGQGAAERGRA
jgi:hypothetical protein